MWDVYFFDFGLLLFTEKVVINPSTQVSIRILDVVYQKYSNKWKDRE